MMYSIKRSGTFIAAVQPTGKVNLKIMDQETVTMNFALPHYIEFKIGDNVVVGNKLFTLNKTPQVTKNSKYNFEYQLEFEGVKYALSKIQMMFLDGDNNYTISDFSVMGNAATHLELVIANANRVSSGWSIGAVIDTPVKNLTFSGQNLLATLAYMADEFGTEFWVDQDKTIHFTEKSTNTGLNLSYGHNNGLFKLNRKSVDGSKVVTRLYPYGSEKNLSNGYRNGSPRLRLENYYIEANVDQYGVIEHTEIFEDIYPHRVGIVTSVVSDNPNKFCDTTINFNLTGSYTTPNPLLANMAPGILKSSLQNFTLALNLNLAQSAINQLVSAQNSQGLSALMPGISAKVTFNTGQLAGYTFEIAAGGWNNTTKEITLLKNADEKSFELPNSVLRPAVGDTYVLTDIIMPAQYIEAAEMQLQIAAQNWLEKHSKPSVQYTVTSDHLYLRRNNIRLDIGDKVHITDNHFNIDQEFRITAITIDLQNEFDVQFEIAESVEVNAMVGFALRAMRASNQNNSNRRTIDQTNRVQNIALENNRRHNAVIGDLSAIPAGQTLIEAIPAIAIPAASPLHKVTPTALENWNGTAAQYLIDMSANPLQTYNNNRRRR